MGPLQLPRNAAYDLKWGNYSCKNILVALVILAASAALAAFEPLWPIPVHPDSK
jgi:hypothetical protein